MKIGVLRSLSFCSLIALALVPAYGTLAALAFLAAGFSVVGFTLGRSVLALRSTVIMLVPLFCLASTIWSDYPASTGRLSVFLTLTVVVAISIGAQLSVQTIAKATLLSHLIPVVLSILIGYTPSNAPWTGVFASKNILAMYSLIAMISGVYIFSTNKRLIVRASICAALFLCFIALIGAQSVGALVSAVATFSAYTGFTFLRRYKLSSRFTFLIVSVAILFVGLILNQLVGELIVQLIASTGKDPTLTGRTDLWAKAVEYIWQHPFFGVGYRAFWVPGNPGAEELWYQFYIESKSGFHFHNTYLSNAVELGLVGMLLQVFVLWSISYQILRLAFLYPNPTLAWAAAFTLLVLTRSLVEVDVFFEFSTITVVLVSIASSLNSSRLKQRASSETNVLASTPTEGERSCEAA